MKSFIKNNRWVLELTAVAILGLSLSGCYCGTGYYPLQERTVVSYGGERVLFAPPVSETKTIKHKLGVIQATKAGSEWEVTVICKYPAGSNYAYNVMAGGGMSSEVVKFRPSSATSQKVVPVFGGAVSLVYAYQGYNSELRITVVDDNANIIHQENLK